MKTPHSVLYRYTAETVAHANKLPAGTMSEQSHKMGMQQGEPLLIALDCMHKYAEAYKERFSGDLLATDQILGQGWLDALKGIKVLFDGDGAIAMMKGIKTDSKDDGCLEALFLDCLKMAGFTEEDLENDSEINELKKKIADLEMQLNEEEDRRN